MATKRISDVADRLINSLKSLQKGEWWDNMQTYQDYPFMRVAMSMGRERSGNKLSWRIGVGSDNEDGHHGLYEDFDTDRPNVMDEGTLEWVNLRKGFAFDERERDPSSDAESLVDDLEVLRNNMFSHMADDIETKAMNVPASSDKLLPNGIPYFIPWNAAGAGTFTSGLPSGHASIAGIDPAVETKWRSWTDTYAAASSDDLGIRLSRAIRNTNWVPPPKVKGEQKVTHAMYMGQTALESIEQLAEAQNDQNGPDIQSKFRGSMVARVRPQWVPYLDDAAAAGSDPIYIVNHAYLFPAFKKGWRFREYEPRQIEKQPTAIQAFVYTTYNWMATSRRHQSVIAKSAPFGE